MNKINILGDLINIIFSFIEYPDFFNILEKDNADFPNITKSVTDWIMENFNFYGKEYFYTRKKDEINSIRGIIKRYSNEALKLNNRFSITESVFYILLNYINPILNVRDNLPVCRNEHILEWAKIIRNIDQDTLITAYIAYKDVVYSQEREIKYFNWPVIIDVYNNRLRNILEKGVSENHFHLYGSSYTFPLSWIDLMNNTENREKAFQHNLGNKKNKLHEENIITDENLHHLYIIAAYRRMYLYKRFVLNESENKLDKDFDISKSRPLNFVCKDIQNKIESFKLLYGKKSYRNLHAQIFENLEINSLTIPDYAVPEIVNENNPFFIFSGERYILYRSFKKLFEGNLSDFDKNEKILYEYVLIKNKLRKELIHSNKKIGFSNFSDYQSRKKVFIQNKFLKKYIALLSIKASFYQPGLKNLEIRWSPQNTKKEYENVIKQIKKYNLQSGKKLKSVIHFIKEKDETISKYQVSYAEKHNRNKFNIGNIERHYRLREKIKKQSLTLNDLKKSHIKTGNEISGIDAASNEIVCPPEVFAQAFRFLKNQKRFQNFLTDGESTDLKLTYHVGEDFLDILTGLRNIDEVINFFDYSPGDRLGHALALGLDVTDYYKFENYNVYLPAQDLLDNIVWLLNKAKEYNIMVSSSLKDKLVCKYEEIFEIIYGKVMPIISYSEYYKSWKLRGDNPRAYYESYESNNKKEGLVFKENIFNQIDLWRKYDFNYRFVPKESPIRKNDKINLLYYYYHYDENVKIKGAKTELWEVDENLIKLIAEVQKELQYIISKKGIGIELNPTSNYVISHIDSLKKHPIANLFNLGLTYNENELENNPQLFVSINTDDQGVFNTSLSQEYALLASAFEKFYKPANIYDWLDRIREMGNEQYFI